MCVGTQFTLWNYRFSDWKRALNGMIDLETMLLLCHVSMTLPGGKRIKRSERERQIITRRVLQFYHEREIFSQHLSFYSRLPSLRQIETNIICWEHITHAKTPNEIEKRQIWNISKNAFRAKSIETNYSNSETSFWMNSRSIDEWKQRNLTFHKTKNTS